MKILESRPGRYDRGIAWLSLGQSERVKRRIVDEHVRPGLRLLEVGVGTGTLAVMAAQAGAEVIGFDINGGMLDLARRKVAAAGLDQRVELREMGVGGMDAYEDESIDLVVATLVLSELSPDEQAYTLRHAVRILRAGGKLVLADEVRPRRRGQRFLHGLVRAPLAALTYVVTQSTTRAVDDLEGRVEQAGLSIEQQERSAIGSFLFMVARKES